METNEVCVFNIGTNAATCKLGAPELTLMQLWWRIQGARLSQLVLRFNALQ